MFQEFVGETCHRNSPVDFKEMDIAFLEYRGHICSMQIIVKFLSVNRELEDVKYFLCKLACTDFQYIVKDLVCSVNLYTVMWRNFSSSSVILVKRTPFTFLVSGGWVMSPASMVMTD